MKYTIKQGNYYSNPTFPSLRLGSPASRTIHFNFDRSCWYEPSAEWNKEGDWNKLWGFSQGLVPHKLAGRSWYKPSSWVSPHHWNSFRIGWRAAGTEEEPRVELCLYVYEEGVRTIQVLLQPNSTPEDIYLDTEYRMEVYTEEVGQVGIVLTLGNGAFLTSQGIAVFPGKVKGSYFLKPYFGGSNPAPHIMTLEVSPQ